MKSRHGDIAEQRSKTKHIRRSPLILAAELFILALLLVTASYAPQVLFHVQDSFLCDATTLDQRESMDVDSLSITYEKSLAQRMKIFAEGLMSEENYYVTSRNLPISQEIYDYLNSEEGLQQLIIQVFAEAEFIPYSFYEMIYVNEWKQYVICSNNYTEGVNFILWYIELTDNQEVILKLLVDAETGTLYAFKTENNDSGRQVMLCDEWYIERFIMWWSFFSGYYEASSEDDISIMYKLSEELQFELEKEVINEAVIHDKKQQDETVKGVELFISDNSGFRQKENVIDFYLPYGEASLEVRILLDAEAVEETEYVVVYQYCQYPNMTIGVRQIYELIPEFS